MIKYKISEISERLEFLILYVIDFILNIKIFIFNFFLTIFDIIKFIYLKINFCAGRRNDDFAMDEFMITFLMLFYVIFTYLASRPRRGSIDDDDDDDDDEDKDKKDKKKKKKKYERYKEKKNKNKNKGDKDS